MKSLAKQSFPFGTIIKEQEYISSESYRFFSFVAIIQYKEVFLLLNTLSRQMIVLSTKEFNDIKSNVRNDLFIKLVNDRFLVAKKHNDFKFNDEVLSLVKLFETKKGITNYIILPTTDCNARCFYCYEHGIEKYHMSDIVSKEVVNFIVKNSFKQPVYIEWFGGEPLYNFKSMQLISDALFNKGINFKTSIITNGYLFDDNIISYLKNKCNLQQVQITLDGTEKVYNKCKAYIYKNDKNPFYTVLNNIEKLLKNGIKVNIRINLDKHNRDDLYSLIDLLSIRFQQYKNYIYTYVWLLYDNRGAIKNIKSNLERHELTQNLFDLEEYIYSMGLGPKSVPSSTIKTSACLADNDNTTIVFPDGKLGKCDHCFENFWGSVFDDEINLNAINIWKEKRELVELCKICPLVPQCHHLKACVDDGAYDCDEYVQMHRLSKLHRQMKNAYDKYLNEKC